MYCLTCSSYTTCTKCIAGYSLGKGKCYGGLICPPGFRYENNNCTKCPDNCESCPSASECGFCSADYALNTFTGLCVNLDNCPVGYYGNKEARVCLTCQPTCKTCINNNYTCTSCKEVDNVSHYLYIDKCVSRCPYLNWY